MQYQGGKAFVGKKIADFINRYKLANTVYYEPFCGALGVAAHIIAEKAHFSDSCLPLINVCNAYLDGWIPPELISEEEYKALKNKKDLEDPLTGFVGFFCSYGGKWFGGYNRGGNKSGRSRNYAAESKRGLIKKFNLIKSHFIEFSFKACDYCDINPTNSLIYCDPPYEGLHGYQYNKTKFNYEIFWDKMREWSKNNKVFISHHNAPDDFECVLEIPTMCGMKRKDPSLIWNGKMEKLFMLRGTK